MAQRDQSSKYGIISETNILACKNESCILILNNIALGAEKIT